MIGPFIFKPVNRAFEGLERTRKYNWKAQERLQRRPAQQFVSLGNDTITIKGTLYNELTPNNEDIAGQIAKMASLRMPMTILKLSKRKAKFYGLFSIVEIKETHSILDMDGQFQKTVYSLKLEHFGADFGGWF